MLFMRGLSSTWSLQTNITDIGEEPIFTFFLNENDHKYSKMMFNNYEIYYKLLKRTVLYGKYFGKSIVLFYL